MRWALLLCLLLWSSLAGANNTRPDQVGTDIGTVDVTSSTGWTPITSASLQCANTAATCAASQAFAEVLIINTHASGSLYLLTYSTTSGPSTTNRITVPAGASLVLPLYRVQSPVRAISITGSTTGVTGRLLIQLTPN
jgi:hypothetical protein